MLGFFFGSVQERCVFSEQDFLCHVCRSHKCSLCKYLAVFLSCEQWNHKHSKIKLTMSMNYVYNMIDQVMKILNSHLQDLGSVSWCMYP